MIYIDERWHDEKKREQEYRSQSNHDQNELVTHSQEHLLYQFGATRSVRFSTENQTVSVRPWNRFPESVSLGTDSSVEICKDELKALNTRPHLN